MILSWPSKMASLILLTFCYSITSAEHRGVVVSGSPESTEIGIGVLKDGGNAADAAVAVSLALGVAEPYGSGIGGKIAILYYDASSGDVDFIDGMVESPQKFPLADYAALPDDQRKRSFKSVCIPGTIAALELLHKDFGRLPWKELVEPVAELAEEGFKVTEHDAAIFRKSQTALRSNPETRRLYTLDGRMPKAGTLLANPDLANTLKILAEEGPSSFYEGSIARKIVAAMEDHDGWITLSDLKNYRARIEAPLEMDWFDYEVYASPSPTTGGATVLLTLKGLEVLPKANSVESGERYNQLSHALQGAYGLYQNFADRPDWKERQKEVFSSSSLRALQREVRARVSTSEKLVDRSQASDDLETSTTHFIVVDQAGNIACVTQSLSNRFGACVIADGTGFLLNNSMSNFAIKTASSPNYIAPSKRPRSSIAPTIVLEEGKPVLAVGSPAGQRIPTSIAQIVSATLLYEQDLEDAIKAPRYHLRRPIYREDADNYLELEKEAGKELAKDLEAYGWDVHLLRSDGYYFGGVNAVLFQPDGLVVEAADPRRSNTAVVID